MKKVRSSARLVRLADGTVVWAESYEADLGVEPLLKIQSDVAGKIFSWAWSKVSDPLILPPHLIKRSPPRGVGGSEKLRCRNRYQTAKLDSRLTEHMY